MAGQRGVQSVKKSSVPGVTITQFVEDIPKGCSTPDFERKPITLTLQEGKNAIFRAVVKGEPKPEVVWKRNNKNIDDPQKYQITFSPASNEFVLQINKITADDADLYRCTAVNEYGEATCTAGLKIIQVGFKKKTKETSSARQGDLKKEIQDFRKTLKKRAPSVLPKKELDMEQVWQLLLHADKKDYERICLKYGIVDFRGMLRKLQEMKKEREDKQAQYISNITNLKHVRVNEEKGNASFDLEMELKNPESRIYLYKDGQMIHFGFDSDNVKHCLRKVGRKYNFIINNVQPEDAGVYQIKVEDVDIFSTELEEETIPMSFRYPLGEVRCHEQGNAVFQCTLYDACFDAVWLHKNCRLQPSDKYDISVSDDGLTHRLLIKNTELSDKGTYTIDVGSRSSSAWLEIESAKGKRKQAESDSDKAGWKGKLLEDGAKKLRQGEGHEDQDSHSDFSMGKDGQYRDGQDGSGEFHGFLGKDGSLEREGKMGQFSGVRGNMAEGNQFSRFAGDSSGVMGFDQNSMLHGSGVSGGPGGLISMGALTGKDTMLGGIPSGTVFGSVGGLHAVQGQGSMLNGASIGGSGVGTDLEGVNYNKEVLHGPSVMPGDAGGLHDKDGVAGLYGKDGMLSGAGAGGIEGIAGLYGQNGLLHGAGAGGPGGAGGIAGLYGKDGTLGGAGAGGAEGLAGLYGKDGMLGGAGAGGPGGAGGAAGLYGKDGMLGGAGADGPGGAGGIAGLYGKDGMLGGISAGGPGVAGGVAGLYGKDAMLGGAGAGGPGGAGGGAGLYGNNGMLGGTGAGGPGGAGGAAGLYGKDGMLGGAGAGGPGGAGGIAGLYGKDGMLGGAHAGGLGGSGGVAGLYDKDGALGGDGAGGPGGAGGVAGLYGKDGMLGGAGAGGPGGPRGIAGLYGKDGMLGGAGAGGPGGSGGVAGLYGKDGMLGGPGAGGPGGSGGIAGLYGKDGMLGGAGAGGPGGSGGVARLYGKDGMLGGAGAGGTGGAGGAAGLYGKDGMLGGAGAGGPGGSGGVAGLYDKDGALGGVGVGGPGGAGSIAGLYGKDGTLGGAGVGGAGGVAGLHGKDGMLGGAGAGGAGGAAGLYGKDGMLGGVGGGGIEGTAGLYGQNGMLGGAGAVGPGGAGGISGLYGKDGTLGGEGAGGAGGVAGQYGKDGMLGGAGAGGPGGAGGGAGLYGKDGMLGGAGAGGPGGAGGIAGLYGKDGMLGGAGAGGPGGAGGVVGLYGKDGMLGGVGAGGPGGVAGLYGKDGMLGGAGAGGPRGAGGAAGLYVKDGMLGGAGAGGAGGVAGLYGKDAMLGGAGGGGPGGAGGVAGLYGKDGMLGGAGGGGPGGAGGGAGLYGKDGMLGGAGTGGPGGAGGAAGLYGKDGMLCGAGAGGPGGVAGLYGKDGMLGGTGAGGPGGAEGIAGLYGTDGMLDGAGAGGSGGVAGLYGKDGMLGGAGAGGPGGAGGVVGLYGKDGALGRARAGGTGGTGGVAGLYGKDGMLGGAGACGPGGAGGVAGLYGKDGMPGRAGAGGPGDAGIAGGLHCKDGVLPGADHGGKGGAGDMQGLYTKNGMRTTAGIDGAGNISGLYSKDGRPAGAGIVGFGEGMIGGPYGMDGRIGGIGAGVSGIDWSLSGVPGEDFQNYNQLSGVQAGNRRRQLSDTDASGLISADISRTRDRKGRGGSLLEEDMREPHCRFTEGLFDIHAEKGKSAVLSCILNNDQLEGTWFKDGFEVTGLEGISVEKNGAIHKLIIEEVQDSHAGKYKFETEGIHTEASLFVEEPPNVDAAVLEKLKKEAVVVKAGKNAMVKIPFEGKKPIRASWLKDDGELLDDARIHTDHSDNFTRLSISSTNRKDCGDYKVKLKNDSGSLEATLKLVVIDKPQPPVGPIEVVDTSTSGITIQWKPPKDDGGKPVQRYIIERQQVGRKTWLTLGETDGNSTIFTTNKVEHDKSYYFKVKAVNAEGTSEALESEEVMAATKVFPAPPAPPKIVSASKDAITLSWGPPHKAGNSRISGYIVEKCKKGSNTWTPVSNLPITDKKYTVTDLKEGLQYEFRVAAINAAGAGEASIPSEAVFAREPMKPPGPVRELKVASTDYTSISLSWKKPESEEESHAKGYIIEMRHSDVLKWTQCNALPTTTTSYTVRKLKPKEMYFLRVKAVNDGGSSDPVELDTYIQAVPPSVYPKLLINDTMKSFMIIKAGDTIRVRVPFEASPTPEVIWLRDGHSLPYKATIATREGLTQVIIPGAEYSDSGLYTITLQTESGKKETFSFLVQVIDIPESPGPIQLVEKVPDTVTLIWEHSPTEKRGHNLYYVVMKRDSSKGSWELVSDLIYTNKCTVSNFIPGREYYFRVLAKNFMGISDPSETVQPWSLHKAKGKFEVRLPRYKGVNQSQPPRFLVQLKPHIVTLGFDCHMSCAVTGYPVPQVTWYKDGKNLSQDPSFVTKNDFGVCSLVIPGVTPSDEGEFKVVASSALGQAVSRAIVTIKASAL